MSRIEEQYRKINDKYNEFSCLVVMNDADKRNRDALKQTTKELAQELNEFWKILKGGTEECQNKKGF